MAPSTSPALAHDTACSALRPPNTTATRTLRADPMHHLRCSVNPKMVAADQPENTSLAATTATRREHAPHVPLMSGRTILIAKTAIVSALACRAEKAAPLQVFSGTTLETSERRRTPRPTPAITQGQQTTGLRTSA